MTSSAAISLFFVLQATRHQLQDFVFAWRQRLDRLTVLTLADVMEQLGHDNRLQERPARVDDANRLEEFFARRTFEQIALRPGLHCAENALVAVESREDDHADGDALRAHGLERSHTIHFRHFEVKQQDIRAQLIITTQPQSFRNLEKESGAPTRWERF